LESCVFLTSVQAEIPDVYGIQNLIIQSADNFVGDVGFRKVFVRRVDGNECIQFVYFIGAFQPVNFGVGHTHITAILFCCAKKGHPFTFFKLIDKIFPSFKINSFHRSGLILNNNLKPFFIFKPGNLYRFSPSRLLLHLRFHRIKSVSALHLICRYSAWGKNRADQPVYKCRIAQVPSGVFGLDYVDQVISTVILIYISANRKWIKKACFFKMEVSAI
jgi:hypothetical protein